MDLAEQARRLKLWYHRGEAHGLTVEQVDAVFDAAARAQPEVEAIALLRDVDRHLNIVATERNTTIRNSAFDAIREAVADFLAEREPQQHEQPIPTKEKS